MATSVELGAAAVPQVPEMQEALDAYRHNLSLYIFRLPTEVRQIIYEYALYLGGRIKPIQVAHRSNKFRLGHYYDLYSIAAETRDVPQPLPLHRVSRIIYRDLVAHPVFYRVNGFEFWAIEELHAFLAAISPRRRQTIRYISIGFRLTTFDPLFHRQANSYYVTWATDHFWDSFITGRFNSSPRRKQRSRRTTVQNILVLLCDCVELRKLTHVSYVTDFRGQIGHLQQSMQGSIAKWSLYNFPQLYLKIQLYSGVGWGHPVLKNENVIIPVGRRSKDILVQNAQADDQELLVRLADSMMNTLIAHHPAIPKITQPSACEVHRAVNAAGIDFPGDVRVAQTLSGGLSNTVSRRTRLSAKAETKVNANGCIVNSRPKYDSEGHFNWDLLYVENIVWNKEAIECEVSFRVNLLDSLTETSTEDLHALCTRTHLGKIAKYYDHLYGRTLPGDHVRIPQSKIDQLRNEPLLSDINDFVAGIIIDTDLISFLTSIAWTNMMQCEPALLRRIEREPVLKAAAQRKRKRSHESEDESEAESEFESEAESSDS